MSMLSKLLSKKCLHVIGSMTGTSLDGLDLALCRISPDGKSYDVRCHQTAFYPFPSRLRARLSTLAGMEMTRKSDLKQLEADLCGFYAGRIIKFIFDYKIKKVDLIGSHGQTIFHHDGRLGKKRKGPSLTWQLGDGGYIAKLTGIPTVSDFRVNDIAAGGSGAPLTPICHYHLFGDKEINTAVLNIGGISNLTYLPAHAKPDHISASDCGPGNMPVDQMMKKMLGKKYDRGGRLALSGKVFPGLLANLKRAPWFARPFPKSLGREQFGAEYIMKIIRTAQKSKISTNDIIATVSELTVVSVEKYLRKFNTADRLIICGGGVHNEYFTKRFSELFSQLEVISSQALGIDPDYVEAISFALLAAMFLNGDPGGLPQITGAKRTTVLGKLSLP